MSKARLLTEEEAIAWCKANPSDRKPIIEEYIQTWNPNKNVLLERIEPQDDFDTADIVGYGTTTRLWTDIPTDEQRKSEPWNR